MIKGGNASIYVSNIENSISFFVDKVGLPLKTRVGEEWAEIDAGEGLIIGLHRARPPETVETGTIGAINIELKVSEPMENVVAKLKERGVEFKGDILVYPAVKIATFVDPDGNQIVLGEPLT